MGGQHVSASVVLCGDFGLGLGSELAVAPDRMPVDQHIVEIEKAWE